MAGCSSALRPTRTSLPPGCLDTLCTATRAWHGGGRRDTEPCCGFTACCRALGDREGITRGGNLTTLERCSVSFSLSCFTPSGFSTPRPGTNGGMPWCYCSLVMLESQLHISFCVRDLIVFVCHRRQINCGVAWQTEPPPPTPSPSSVPPASPHSQLTRVCLPLLSCPPLSLQLCLSPAPYRSLSPALCSFGAGSPPLCAISLLHYLLGNRFRRCCAASRLLSSSRLPSV